MGKSTGVYLSDQLYEKAVAKAELKFRGKVGTYIANLVEKDLSVRSSNRKVTTTGSANCLVELCDVYCPDFSEYMKSFCERHNLSQPLALSALLRLFSLGQSGISTDELAKHYSIPKAAEEPAKYGKNK